MAETSDVTFRLNVDTSNLTSQLLGARSEIFSFVQSGVASAIGVSPQGLGQAQQVSGDIANSISRVNDMFNKMYLEPRGIGNMLDPIWASNERISEIQQSIYSPYSGRRLSTEQMSAISSAGSPGLGYSIANFLVGDVLNFPSLAPRAWGGWGIEEATRRQVSSTSAQILAQAGVDINATTVRGMVDMTMGLGGPLNTQDVATAQNAYLNSGLARFGFGNYASDMSRISSEVHSMARTFGLTSSESIATMAGTLQDVGIFPTEFASVSRSINNMSYMTGNSQAKSLSNAADAAQLFLGARMAPEGGVAAREYAEMALNLSGIDARTIQIGGGPEAAARAGTIFTQYLLSSEAAKSAAYKTWETEGKWDPEVFERYLSSGARPTNDFVENLKPEQAIEMMLPVQENAGYSSSLIIRAARKRGWIREVRDFARAVNVLDGQFEKMEDPETQYEVTESSVKQIAGDERARNRRFIKDDWVPYVDDYVKNVTEAAETAGPLGPYISKFIKRVSVSFPDSPFPFPLAQDDTVGFKLTGKVLVPEDMREGVVSAIASGLRGGELRGKDINFEEMAGSLVRGGVADWDKIKKYADMAQVAGVMSGSGEEWSRIILRKHQARNENLTEKDFSIAQKAISFKGNKLEDISNMPELEAKKIALTWWGKLSKEDADNLTFPEFFDLARDPSLAYTFGNPGAITRINELQVKTSPATSPFGSGEDLSSAKDALVNALNKFTLAVSTKQ